MKIKSFFAILILSTAILLTGATSAFAADSSDTVIDVQTVIDGILYQKLERTASTSVQNFVDTSLTESVGVGGEWYAYTLAAEGECDLSGYAAALADMLADTTVRSATSRLKYALVLRAAGYEATDPLVTSLIDSSVGEQGIMSLVYSLHLLNNGCLCTTYTYEEVVQSILSMQCTDGGWSLLGEVGDVDVTAMTVQALSPLVPEYEAVASSVDEALSFLAQSQTERGGYVSYGVENPESSCQVLIALSSLGIDCTADERFIKNGSTVLDAILDFRLDDGSFCHSTGEASNELSTVQTYMAMTAYLRMHEGRSPIYILETEEVQSSDGTSASDETSETEEAVEKSEVAWTVAETEVSETTTSAEPVESFNDTALSDTNAAEKDDRRIKPIVCAIIVAVGGSVCVVLLLLGKRHPKHFITPIVLTASAVVFVLVSDIRTADDYYSGKEIVKSDPIGNVTLTIRCDNAVGAISHVPEDGVILAETEFTIEEGESVFELLTEAAQTYRIQLDSSGSGGMVYVSGIAYLYEFELGDLSGWMYRVNGTVPSVGCGEYVLSDGDRVEWLYTCSLGEDLGEN